MVTKLSLTCLCECPTSSIPFHLCGTCRAGDATHHITRATAVRTTRRRYTNSCHRLEIISPCHTIMARSHHRPLLRRLMVSAVVCCSVLLLRPHGGGFLAQGNGGGDDDDGDTLPPAGGAASSEDVSSEYPDCPGYTSHIADGYCDGDLNIASCGWDGGNLWVHLCLFAVCLFMIFRGSGYTRLLLYGAKVSSCSYVCARCRIPNELSFCCVLLGGTNGRRIRPRLSVYVCSLQAGQVSR